MRNRRALSLLITLMMIVSMFAGTGLPAALAESAIKGVVQINTLDELKQALKSQNNVTLQLMKDIIGDGKSETCQVDGKTLTLDLNGHTLSANNYHSAIWVTGKAELTIVDSAGGGKITGGNATRGGGINVGDSAVVTFESGTITDNKASDQGGGVYVYGKGTFNMNGGVIEKNTAAKQGGAIYNSGALTATGATLQSNFTTGGGGGALFNKGDAKMTDCVLKANTASSRGGAILNEKGYEATLTNCVVTDNYAKGSDGGGIVNYGTLNVTGGEFTKNESWASGGGIFLTQDSTATITGTVFTGNVAGDKGGALMVRPNSSCTLENVTVTGNRAALYGGGIDVENKPKAFNINGAIVVQDNECTDKMGKDVYLGNTVTITQTGALTEGSQIGVYVSGNQNYAFVNGFTTYNKGEKPAKYFVPQEGFWVMSGEDGAEPYVWNSTWKLIQEMIDETPDGGTIVLDRDYAGNEADKSLRIPENKNITLDLNGHTLNRGLTAIQSGGSAIIVNIGATLTIRDSAGGGKITGGANGAGGGIYNNGGTLNLESGAITGNLANYGGGVYAYSGDTNISGGEITENRANKSGGGVHMTISGNVNLTGGAITGNRAQEGGGVYNDTKMGGLYVQGAPVVNDNYAPSGSNIKLKNGKRVTVAARLEDGALLDLSAEKNAGLLTSGLQASGSSLDTFTYNGNNGSVKPILKDGELYVDLDVKADVWVSDWSGLQKAVDNATNGQVIALSNDIKSGSAGHIWVNGKTVTIDLNGYTIEREIGSQEKGGHVIEVSSGGNLTIRDSVGTGLIKGGNAERGGGIDIVDTSTLNFEGGTISGNRAHHGSGIYVHGTLNMSGGAISANSGASRGGAINVGEGGKANITGGTIIDNSAEWGAGIYVNGTLDVSGARFESNNSTIHGGGAIENHGSTTVSDSTFVRNHSVGRGGAIFNDANHKVTVKDSVFTGNSTDVSGSAIFTYGDLELTDGTFTGNAAKANGGALAIMGKTATIRGGTFTGNKAGDQGGAIFVTSDDSKATLNLYDGSFTGNTASKGGGIAVGGDCTFNLHGSTVVKDNKASALRSGPNLFLLAKDDYQESLTPITLEEKLSPEAEIHVAVGTFEGTFTNGYASVHAGEDPFNYFKPEETEGVWLTSDGEAKIISTDWSDLQREINAAEDGATIALQRNWNGGSLDDALTIPEGKTLTLDLNGYSLYRGAKNNVDNGSTIVVSEGATLTIQDKTGRGTITGGAARSGGGILNYGTLNLEGGIITGNQATNGGGVYNYGTMTVSGGAISKNTSAMNGGGIFNDNGTLRVTGGRIENIPPPAAAAARWRSTRARPTSPTPPSPATRP